MREVHFFEREEDLDDWFMHQLIDEVSPLEDAKDYEKMDWIMRNLPEGDVMIGTTQMSFLSASWFDEGFRIFVHDRTGTFEIKLGEDNERTTRMIRHAHNLFRLWENGEFAVDVKSDKGEEE